MKSTLCASPLFAASVKQFRNTLMILVFGFLGLKNSLAQTNCSPTYTLSQTTIRIYDAATGTWTAPATGGPYLVKITAKGAQGGGAGTNTGGAGAIMIGSFVVNSGQVLNITAGAPGVTTGAANAALGSGNGGGGGGGSGVYITNADNSHTILLIAGGGGGAGFNVDGDGGYTGTCGGGGSGLGGCDGDGGGQATVQYVGGSGGGLFTRGGTFGGLGANGGGSGVMATGGITANFPGGEGGSGIGGGGGGSTGGGTAIGANSYGGGGGGGGYSGGFGSDPGIGGKGFGGGSINNGTNQTNIAGANGAGGEVTIECLGPLAASTTTSLSSSLNPSFTTAPNNSVVFTATITSGGSAVNGGTVTFTDGANTIAGGGAVAVSNGIAQVVTTFSSEGTHNIKATYNPTSSYLTSNGTVSQTVNNHTQVSGNTFCNTGPLTLLSNNSTTPYPSHIFVTGLPGKINSISINLNNITATNPSEIALLLVAPGGQQFVILAGAGGTSSVSSVNLTLSDGGSSLVPTSTLVSGTFRPSAYASIAGFPAPAPAGPYNYPAAAGAATLASVFNGSNPNGTWSLYAIDGGAGNAAIAGGWCLNITAPSPSLITANAGTTPQSAVVSTAFINSLAATVTDAASNPVSDVSVTFSAPSSGASGTFSNGTNTITVTTDVNGVATAGNFTANATAGGPYLVTAAVAGTNLTANFSLTNTAAVATCPSTYALIATSANVNATTGTWTAPATGGPFLIKITAAGAQGGSAGSFSGGKGATMQGTFVVNAGQTLNITAGSPGEAPGAQALFNGQFYSTGGGGGGGSGVYTGTTSNPTVLIIAGGGGGSNLSASGLGGNVTTCGSGGTSCSGGGGASYQYMGSGGGGLTAPGQTNASWGNPGEGGVSASGGAGVSNTFNSLGAEGSGGGGIGGGGSGGGGGGPQTGDYFDGGGGGGGGYSGGDGGNFQSSGGGGGGSINNGTNQINTVGANVGGGYVTIECLGSAGPTASVLSLSGNSAVCSGSSTTISVAITGGTSPYTVVYSDGTTNFTVNNYTSGANISVSPTANTTYSLVSVTDANSATGTGNAGTAAVTVNPLPTASINNSTGTVASGTSPIISVTVSVPATDAWTLVLSDNTSYSSTGPGTFSIPAKTAISTQTTYTITSLTDNTTGCAAITAGLTGSETVSITITITSVLSVNGSSSICSGTSTNLVVTITGGTSPYTVVYSNGTSPFTVTNYTSGANIPVSPTVTTTYSLVSVADVNQVAGTGNSGTPTITVNNPLTCGKCPSPQGVWKNSAATWPASALPMLLGTSRTYTTRQLLNIFNNPSVGDASIILADQLIAAKLNVASGVSTTQAVLQAISAADAAIGTKALPMNVKTNTSLGKTMTRVATSLEQFNNGFLNPGCSTTPLITTSLRLSTATGTEVPDNVTVQNYPNPFTGTTSIRYTLPAYMHVLLEVYNNLGQRIAELVNSNQQAGTHEVRFNGVNHSAGIYHYRLQTIEKNGKLTIFFGKMMRD